MKRAALVIALILSACGGGDDQGAPMTLYGSCEFPTAEDVAKAIDNGMVCRVFEAGTVWLP